MVNRKLIEVALSLEAINIIFSLSRLRFHDVDNRPKVVMDALQGRSGGPKEPGPALRPLVPNDGRVLGARIEKNIAEAGEGNGAGGDQRAELGAG